MSEKTVPVQGIINVLKPPGMTSHDVITKIRHMYHIKKAGHAGTLDPDAAGVLPVFLGNATRLLEYASAERKCYRAEALLGVRTDTGDDSGTPVEEKTAAHLTRAKLEQVLAQFRGQIMQVPPMYSALKVQGKKLYEYARQGQEIVREPRPIEIFHLQLVVYDPPYFTLDIECSKGTYIRTLLEDIAAAADTCACMTFLLRTGAGRYPLAEAFTLEEIAAAPEKVLLPPETAVAHFPLLAVNPLQAYRITGGVRTTIKGTAEGTYRLYCGSEFLGLVQAVEEIVQPLKILQQTAKPAETGTEI
ncbi:MAG: tRNA pseudouridine(55) synthase TruB [Succiniclasticum sp.]|nr:tRNA pseudouridine(55) synthase TruB [Succiniclasticum sp.]